MVGAPKLVEIGGLKREVGDRETNRKSPQASGKGNTD